MFKEDMFEEEKKYFESRNRTIKVSISVGFAGKEEEMTFVQTIWI